MEADDAGQLYRVCPECHGVCRILVEPPPPFVLRPCLACRPMGVVPAVQSDEIRRLRESNAEMEMGCISEATQGQCMMEERDAEIVRLKDLIRKLTRGRCIEETGELQDYQCFYCGEEYYTIRGVDPWDEDAAAKLPHKPDCPWVEARALLGEQAKPPARKEIQVETNLSQMEAKLAELKAQIQALQSRNMEIHRSAFSLEPGHDGAHFRGCMSDVAANDREIRELLKVSRDLEDAIGAAKPKRQS